MTKRLGLFLIITIIITIFAHHRLIFKLAPHLLNHILQQARLSSIDNKQHLELETLEELTSIPLVGTFFIEEK